MSNHRIVVRASGTAVVMNITFADGRADLHIPLSPGDAWQLATMLTASVADAASNHAFEIAAKVSCPDCQVKVGRARQDLLEKAQGAKRAHTKKEEP